ncbi:hypothetical protein, partial [Salmonella enterica]
MQPLADQAIVSERPDRRKGFLPQVFLLLEHPRKTARQNKKSPALWARDGGHKAEVVILLLSLSD